jgi:glycosyltransferase involved in cell wall biosynthesis
MLRSVIEKSFISVIVPVYNVAPYVCRAIDSLLHQTWPNMEIILIDDGSLDDSGKICDEYARKHENIIVIHQANKGVSAARNAGLHRSSGDYIGFVDPDDFISETMYEFLYNMLAQTGADIAVCGYDDYNDDICMPYTGVFYHDVVTSNEAIVREIRDGLFVTWNKLFTRNCIKDIWYHAEYINGEDRLFTVESMCQARNVAYYMKPQYHYCHRADSAGTKPFSPNDYRLIELCEEIRDIFGTRGIKETIIAEAQITKAYMQLLEMMKKNPQEYPLYRSKLMQGLRKRWYHSWNEPLPNLKFRIKLTLYAINPTITWKMIALLKIFKTSINAN